MLVKGGGSRHRTVSYTLNFVNGFEKLKEKWDLHLESSSGGESGGNGKVLCVRGQQSWPKNLIWKTEAVRQDKFEYSFENDIGFGHNCEEHTIKTKGNSRVSDRQKERSRESEEGRRHDRLVERGVPAAELAEVAERVREQASRLDELDFVVKYQNVPKRYMVVPEYLVQGLKALWWTSLAPGQSSSERREGGGSGSGSDVSGTSEYKIRFSPPTGTFNLTIHRFGQVIRFEHVTIPSPLKYVLPMRSARGSLVDDLAVGVTGDRSVRPKCKVEDRWIKTFGQSTVDLKLDDCPTLLAADCSSRKRFAVMVKKTSSASEDSAKELKIYLGKTDIHLRPSGGHSRQSPKIKVVVNGTEIPISRRHPVEIKDERGDYSVGEVVETEDGVIVLTAPLVEIKFDGEKVEIKPSYQLKGKLCGLCGDLNAYVVGPSECSYSRNELLAASYRVNVPSAPCKSLPRQVEEELENENRVCAKFEEVPTKVLRAYEAHAGKCTVHRHEIIDRGDRLCFSRTPVTECSSSCRPSSSSGGGLTEKKVSFACLDKNRAAKHYADKVREGKVLKELENLPKDFSVTMTLPRHCVPV
jgi:hypothetical protein